MKQVVEQFLDENPELSKGDLLLAAVSGGPDSLSLAHVLSELGHRVMIAHLDHQIRDESEAEARMVEEFARGINAEFRSKRVDVPGMAKRHGSSLEEEAREQRYAFLCEVADEEEAKAVLVGHTADDQVETVLMHLLRGAGLSGLKGMEPVTTLKTFGSDVPLLRPLLGVWRREVMAYCRENDLQPLFDRSNLDTTFFRNRIRHELIPNLESYNPKVREGILRMAGILAEDHKALERVVSGGWEDCVREWDGMAVRFDLIGFKRQPLAIRRALIRWAVGVLRPSLKDFDFQAVENAVRFVDDPTERHGRDLAAHLRIALDGNSFWIAHWDAELRHSEYPSWDDGTQTLRLPGDFDLGHGWWFRAEKMEGSGAIYEKARSNEDGYEGWFDGDFVGNDVILRSRRAGERFRPLGMAGKSVKLADFLINVKIPRLARDSWPLFCRGDEVIWVPGYRQSDSSKLTPESKMIFHFQLTKE